MIKCWFDPKKNCPLYESMNEPLIAIVNTATCPVVGVYQRAMLVLKRHPDFEHFHDLNEWFEYVGCYVEDCDLKQYFKEDIVAWAPLPFRAMDFWDIPYCDNDD